MAVYRAKVDGMMCNMCEKHMREAVEERFGAADVTADHVSGMVEFSADADVNADSMRACCDEAGYELVDFEVRI